jgi:hypothetical protein
MVAMCVPAPCVACSRSRGRCSLWSRHGAPVPVRTRRRLWFLPAPEKLHFLAHGGGGGRWAAGRLSPQRAVTGRPRRALHAAPGPGSLQLLPGSLQRPGHVLPGQDGLQDLADRFVGQGHDLVCPCKPCMGPSLLSSGTRWGPRPGAARRRTRGLLPGRTAEYSPHHSSPAPAVGRQPPAAGVGVVCVQGLGRSARAPLRATGHPSPSLSLRHGPPPARLLSTAEAPHLPRAARPVFRRDPDLPRVGKAQTGGGLHAAVNLRIPAVLSADPAPPA